MPEPDRPAHKPFAVWAPCASAVALSADGARFELSRDENGWWSPSERDIVRATANGEVDYGYLIDGRGPYPDPRSRRQPYGVHGLSRTYDPAGFAWTDRDWPGRELAGSLIYELHVGTFTPQGTLDAAIAKLDHLLSIGVDLIELLPVNDFNGIRNWGYDGVLWYAVHEPYGGPAAYQRFVDACHARGIGVIQDVVYNHLGPSGNVLPQFGPYLSEERANTWGSAVNLDGPDSDEVRRYILDNATMWLSDYHVDGLRLDAVHALPDTRAINILEELADAVDALSQVQGRPLILIAESDLNDPRLIDGQPAGGYGLDAQWSDDFHHALHVALTGETTGYFADFAAENAVEKVVLQGFFHDGTYSSFRGRHHGRPINVEDTPTWRLVVFSQNHDQVGNRAAGDRLSQSLDDGQLAIAAALTMLGPFTPMLFMGEEWAASTPWQFFTSHPESELGEVTARGRIEEFERMGWDESDVPDPQDPETFQRSVLDWSELETGRHRRILELYQGLARLRRTEPDFTDGRFDHSSVRSGASGTWLAVDRGRTTLAVNFGTNPAEVPFVGSRSVALTFGDVTTTDSALMLGPHSLAVIAPTPDERPSQPFPIAAASDEFEPGHFLP